jgi:hypothetical protein
MPALAVMPLSIPARRGGGGPAMSLDAWERKALDSIKDGLAGSDPGLAAMLSAFNRLESDEELPDREKIRTSSRRTLRWLSRGRRRSSLRRACQQLGFQRAAVLLLWLLTTAVMIAVGVMLSTGGNHGTCTEMAAIACASPGPAHSTGSPSHQAATGQESEQRIAGIPQTGP